MQSDSGGTRGGAQLPSENFFTQTLTHERHAHEWGKGTYIEDPTGKQHQPKEAYHGALSRIHPIQCLHDEQTTDHTLQDASPCSY